MFKCVHNAITRPSLSMGVSFPCLVVTLATARPGGSGGGKVLRYALARFLLAKIAKWVKWKKLFLTIPIGLSETPFIVY